MIHKFLQKIRTLRSPRVSEGLSIGANIPKENNGRNHNKTCSGLVYYEYEDEILKKIIGKLDILKYAKKSLRSLDLYCPDTSYQQRYNTLFGNDFVKQLRVELQDNGITIDQRFKFRLIKKVKPGNAVEIADSLFLKYKAVESTGPAIAIITAQQQNILLKKRFKLDSSRQQLWNIGRGAHPTLDDHTRHTNHIVIIEPEDTLGFPPDQAEINRKVSRKHAAISINQGSFFLQVYAGGTREHYNRTHIKRIGSDEQIEVDIPLAFHRLVDGDQIILAKKVILQFNCE